MAHSEQFILTPTSYGTFVSKTGLEFVQNTNGEFVLGSTISSQQKNADVNAKVANVGGNIGSLEEFKENSDWNIYSERLEQYFNANFVDESRRVSVLITAIGDKVYKTLRDLCTPVLPKDKTYKELCEVLKKHYSPRVSVYIERKSFYQLRQNSSETVSQWYARVKQGSADCEFGQDLESRIKDQFITGMREGKILDRIFEEDHKSSLAAILELALKKEALAIYWAVNKFFQYLKGTHFILETDHKPLLALFGEEKGIPQMAAGRMQRWAYFLSGFDYTLKYVKGKHNGGADGLSRLPLNVNGIITDSEFDYFNFLIEDKLPIDAKQIRKEVRNDKILSRVYDYTRNGWPEKVDKELQPYFIRSHEISIDQELLLWGYRVIIPLKFRNDILKEIHVTHMGSTKMKALARQYFWWPKLDLEIEQYSKNCDVCNKAASSPNKATLIKYEQCKEALERVHIDFLGPVNNKMYFIVLDAYSKWPEVYVMNNITSENTLCKLREFCARFGLPKKIISDNGRQLVSEEFEKFCKVNGIKHIPTPPYHPSSNGAAENAVKSFKSGLKKALLDPANKNVKIETLVSRYLFSYRMTPHCFTGETPAKLMLGRELRSRFDLLKESKIEANAERQIKNYSGKREALFDIGDMVWIRDYKCPDKPTWIKAQVIDCLGSRNYLCKSIIEKLVYKRHIDQMRKAGILISNELHETFTKKPIVENSVIPDEPEKCKINFPIVREGPTPIALNKENCEESTLSSDEIVVVKDLEPKKDVKLEHTELIETFKGEEMCETGIQSKLESEKCSVTVENVSKPKVTLNVNERPKRTIKKPQRLNL